MSLMHDASLVYPQDVIGIVIMWASDACVRDDCIQQSPFAWLCTQKFMGHSES